MNIKQIAFLFLTMSFSAIGLAGTGDVGSANMPNAVGTCKISRILKIGTRLKDTPGSGSYVTFEKGGSLVSYEQEVAVDEGQVGDQAMICMTEIDLSCPIGSGQGLLTITNLRTKKSAVMGTSSHQCDGA